ncbi:MAG: A/G-specific adenine glycosylase [Marinilabilia sp.]
MTRFPLLIRKWYLNHGRSLPWRETRDPYKIWISEIILQQTQVTQGKKYYLNFLRAFPDVHALAEASEKEVLQQWQGLGYYSRARNLHQAAKTIVKEHNGLFPQTYKKIQTLKGIGPYTASAIASFAFDLPYAVVDGNVYRLLSRIYAISTPVDTHEGKNQFKELADRLLDRNDPATHNQAIMETGAMICRPSLPLCSECPVAHLCKAFAKGKQTEFPVKSKRKVRKKRYLNFLIIHCKDNILIQKRQDKDIWQGLYQFPLIETPHKPTKKIIARRIYDLTNTHLPLKKIMDKKHLLTHQELQTAFYRIEWPENLAIPENFIKTQPGWISPEEAGEFPFPQLIKESLHKILR